MKTIAKISEIKNVIFVAAILFVVLITPTATAQDTIRSDDGEITRIYQRPIHPENYLYLPSFKNRSYGLDYWNYPEAQDMSTSIAVFNETSDFDSTRYLPPEAISQKFMIDSTITIYGVALYRNLRMFDSSLALDWCRIEDSILIQSLNHDTVYRAMSIAHLRLPEFNMGIYEYYFLEPLTISKPFTVVEKFSREHYRRIYEFFNYPDSRATICLGNVLDPQNFFHSYQRPSIKHYGDSNWYEFVDDPHYIRLSYCSHWPDGYTDLFMLPIYSKAPEPVYNISVSAMPENYGSVSGSGSYDMFTYVTLQATANENYRFVRWQDGNRENPRTIRVMSDSTFVAIFDTILYNVHVSSTPEGYGSVDGGGLYDPDTYVTIEAIPNENYRFVCWHDNICDNPRTLKLLYDTTFIAHFDTILPNNIEPTDKEDAITIRPNPATTTLNIELPQCCTAELRNIKGVLIETKQLQANATQWNIEALPPGVYMLTFRNKDWVITRKFVKK